MQAGALDTGPNGVDIGTTVTSVTVPHSPVMKRAGRRHIHTRVSGLSIITDSQTFCECFPAEGFHRTSVGHLNVVTTVRFATGGSRYASPLLVCRTATGCRTACRTSKRGRKIVRMFSDESVDMSLQFAIEKFNGSCRRTIYV